MTIYSIAVDFITTLLGVDIASTARGALFVEYFGYFVIAITIYLLVKFFLWMIIYPINLYRGK